MSALTPPAASAEFMARYDRFDARAMWQNVNMTPDFPTAASLMAGMWQEATGTGWGWSCRGVERAALTRQACFATCSTTCPAASGVPFVSTS